MNLTWQAMPHNKSTLQLNHYSYSSCFTDSVWLSKEIGSNGSVGKKRMIHRYISEIQKIWQIIKQLIVCCIDWPIYCTLTLLCHWLYDIISLGSQLMNECPCWGILTVHAWSHCLTANRSASFWGASRWPIQSHCYYLDLMADLPTRHIFLLFTHCNKTAAVSMQFITDTCVVQSMASGMQVILSAGRKWPVETLEWFVAPLVWECIRAW